MNRQTAKKIVLWVIVIATMVGIFCFSAQNANDSNDTSGSFARTVLGIFPFFRDMNAAEQDGLIESVMTIVRKLAHFSIYAFLGFWMRFLVSMYRNKYTVSIAVALAAAYAVTDEIHQLFVPGRSGQFRDVLIDTSGALTGAVIAFILAFLWHKLRNKVKKQR